jgi:hypothetical protein
MIIIHSTTKFFVNKYYLLYRKKYFKAQLASVNTLVDQVSNDTSRCHYLPSLDCSVAAVYCLHFWEEKLGNVLEKFILDK